jgi:indolepyruvate ferredoxin oxidoreductase
MQMARAHRELAAAGIVFQPGLNEDLAATALWGTQQAGLRGEGRHRGRLRPVVWQGAGGGPVGRCDAARQHGRHRAAWRGHHGDGRRPYRRILDDLHQSDWAMVDAYMPVLSPAGVQEILDYGAVRLCAVALCRRLGGAEADEGHGRGNRRGRWPARPDGLSSRPISTMPEGGLNIRLQAITGSRKRRASSTTSASRPRRSGHANRIDRPVWGDAGARIGFVAAGKNWLDLIHALDLLGIGEAEAERLGLTTYKVGRPGRSTWPASTPGRATSI